MITKLLAIDEWFVSHSIMSPLNKGINYSTINTLLLPITNNIPPLLITLYEWHNGNTISSFTTLPLAGNMYFLPIEDAIEAWYNLQEVVSKTKELYLELGLDQIWKETYFPIFANCGGDYYVIECDYNVSTFGQIFYFSLKDYADSGILVYESLQTMFEALYECYVKLVFKIEDSQVKDINFDELAKISNYYNSQSNYWSY
jgi:hypothetical protein